LKRVRFVLFGTFAAAILYTTASGQNQPRVAVTPRSIENKLVRRPANLRLDVRLVLVPVSVTDGRDRPVHMLPQERFRVLEDGVEQKIASFSQEEGPISMGIAFDSSGSMKDRIESSVDALKLLFQTTTPGDEFFLVHFSDRARLLCGFTPEPGEIFSQLGRVEAKGWTALLDAIALSTNKMRSAQNRRRVLLVLSDGNDNNSRFSEAEVRHMVIEGDLRVYGIGLLHRPRMLQQLADETGGDVLMAQNLSELPDVVERLSREIRSQYLLGYSSSNPANDSKYRRVKVEVLPQAGEPPLRVSWRRGYYAPGE
jgi:VWFA-related protein